MADLKNKINILNKRASFEFSFIEKFVAGMQLTGTEIKSIRDGKCNITDGYCFFKDNELWVKNVLISEYEKGTHYNHEPKRDRKLLLNKSELNRLLKKLKDQGLTKLLLQRVKNFTINARISKNVIYKGQEPL